MGGGGRIAQVYAIRQALSKSLVAYYQKFVDEQSKKAIKDTLVQYDRSLLVADPRRCEPKVWRSRCPRQIPEVLPLIHPGYEFFASVLCQALLLRLLPRKYTAL